MNIALWIVQALLGLAFVAAGVSHGFRPERMMAQPGGHSLPMGGLHSPRSCRCSGDRISFARRDHTDAF
jgi:hypothetical protein